LFPVPPPPEFVTNCSDGGVIGAVPGIIGTLQALETIKLLSDIGPSYVGKMLIFDGLQGTFTDVKIRSRQSSCAVCGDNPTITTLTDDYPKFCGSSFDDKDRHIQILKQFDRITPTEYETISKSKTTPHVLIDVREPQELEICAIPDVSMNVPYSQMYSDKSMDQLKRFLKERARLARVVQGSDTLNVYVVCRRGNDSQRAVRLLQEKFSDLNLIIKDIEGGLHAWARDVDKSFPVY
jgi:adenylyltransferase/sulfurtransferase